MTRTQRLAADARRAGRNLGSAAGTALAGGEMLQAAGEVIGARLEILRAGLADPAKADVREMMLMSSEKVEAATASAASLTRSLGDASASLGKAALDEVGYAGRAFGGLDMTSGPAAIAAAQGAYALGWWSRAGSRMLAFNSQVLKAQAEALEPIRAAAVANARRLKR